MLGMISGLTLAASMLVTVPAAAGTTATSESIVGAAALVWDESAGAQRKVSAEDARRIVNEYWTPERLASATPAVPPAGTTKGKTAAPVEKAVTAASPATPAGGPSTRDAWFSYTNGKIFFVDPRDNQRSW